MDGDVLRTETDLLEEELEELSLRLCLLKRLVEEDFSPK